MFTQIVSLGSVIQFAFMSAVDNGLDLRGRGLLSQLVSISLNGEWTSPSVIQPPIVIGLQYSSNTTV